MAGLDANGGIAPPPPGATISREPIQWKRHNYGALLTEQRRDSTAHVAIMRHLRAAAIEMERTMGGPIEIMQQINTGDGFTITFRRIEPDPPAT